MKDEKQTDNVNNVNNVNGPITCDKCREEAGDTDVKNHYDIATLCEYHKDALDEIVANSKSGRVEGSEESASQADEEEPVIEPVIESQKVHGPRCPHCKVHPMQPKFYDFKVSPDSPELHRLVACSSCDCALSVQTLLLGTPMVVPGGRMPMPPGRSGLIT